MIHNRQRILQNTNLDAKKANMVIQGKPLRLNPPSPRHEKN